MFKKSLFLLFACLLVFLQSGAWAMETGEYNFDYKVEAVKENKVAEESSPANIQPMTAEAARDLLDKLPALPFQNKPTKFDLSGEQLRRNKKNVAVLSFPANVKSEQKDADKKIGVPAEGPLTVKCNQQGEIEKLTQLTFSFSKPMVNLFDLAKTDEKPFIKMTPQPAGKWYWTSPDVLVFDPEGGTVPYATDYVVRLRDGVKCDGPREWRFRTPRLEIVGIEEQKPFGEEKFEFRKPIWRVVFNQSIDPTRLSEHLQLRTLGRNKSLPIIRIDDLKGNYLRSLLVRPVEAVDRRSSLQFVLPKGAPSLEGPLFSDKDQSIDLKGVLPLQISDVELSAQGRRGDKFGEIVYRLRFIATNRLVRDELSAGMIRFEPPAMKISQNYYDYGRSNAGEKNIEYSSTYLLKPSTNYKVTFSKDIEDQYGQRLGKDTTFRVKSGPVEFCAIGEFNKNSISLQDRSPKPLRFETYGGKRVRLTLHKATADDSKFLFERTDTQEGAKLAQLPGEQLHSEERSTNVNGSIVEFDVKSIQSRGLGRYLVSCEVLDDSTGDVKAVSYRLLQVTNLIVAVYGEHPSVYVGDTTTGAPVVGAKVGLVGRDDFVTTNKMGIAYLSVGNSPRKMDFIEAKNGDDACICRVFNFYSNINMPIGERDRLLAFPDRGLYRPGEPLRIKGWLRKPVVTDDGQVLLKQPAPCDLVYKWFDSKFQVVKEGAVAVDRFGGFEVEADVPIGVATGRHYMSFEQRRNGKVTLRDVVNCTFRVQEFRRPEFELKLTSSTTNKIVVGEKVRLSLSGSSLSGGLLRGAKTTWTVSPGRGHLYGESYPGFSFRPLEESLNGPEDLTRTLELESDDFGESAIELSPTLQSNCAQVEYHVNATMQDVNRQERQASTLVRVLPADFLVGLSALQTNPSLVGKPDKIDCRVICIDRKGELVKEISVDLSIAEILKGQPVHSETRKLDFAGKSASIEYQRKSMDSTVSFSAQVADKQGRIHRSAVSIAPNNYLPTVHDTSQPVKQAPRIKLSLDKTLYHEGEIAEVTLDSEVSPFAGTLLQLGSEIHRADSFLLSPGVHTQILKVPVGKLNSPEVLFEILPAERATPEMAIWPSVKAKLLPAEGLLSLSVKPGKLEYRPGEDAEIEVQTEYANNKGDSESQVVLAVVDDAVMQLSQYKWPQPPFFRSRSQISPLLSRDLDRGINIMVANSRIVAGRIGESGGPDGRYDSVSGAFDGGLDRMDPRSNMTPLAYFSPSIETDKDGRAKAVFKMPGNITRYKIFALAAKDFDKFAGAESSILAAMPLSVKHSPPRFLNYQDSFELPLVVHNQTDKSLTCSVVVRGNKVQLFESGKLVTVPAGGRKEVRFTGRAIESGNAVLQCAVVSGALRDSAQFEIPIHRPLVQENVAIAGVIDDGSMLQRIGVPLSQGSDVLQQVGALKVNTSSSAFPSLKSTYDYLYSYPYDCTEQLSSRVIAILSMHTLMKSFSLLSEEDEQKGLRQVDADLRHLLERQNLSTGGFGFWSVASKEDLPFASAQAVQAMYLAKQKGRAVWAYALSKGLDYLGQLDLKDLSVKAKLPILAKVLNVRHKCGVSDAKAVRDLVAQSKPDDISPEVAAWLIPIVLQDRESKEQLAQLKEILLRNLTQPATTATVVDRGQTDFDYRSFTSNERADAAAMEALMVSEAESPLIAKLAKGLMDKRENGIWVGTQANSYVAQALVKYFQKYESQVPNFKVRTFLDEANVDNQQFVGRATKAHEISVPMSYLVEHKVKDLQIDKVGTGRLYYNAAISYAPNNQNVGALSHGFVVEREYRVHGSGNLIAPAKDGAIHVKAGSTIDVLVQIKTHSPRFHTVLCDNFPAGLEPVFGSLDGSRFSHLDLRDNAAQAFATVLSPGLNSISYSLQATTPGRFNVPPCRIEEMYSPETFARTAAELVIVE